MSVKPTKDEFEKNVKQVILVDPETGNTNAVYHRCDLCLEFFNEEEVLFTYNDATVLLDRRVLTTTCLKCIELPNDKIEKVVNAPKKRPQKITK